MRNPRLRSALEALTREAGHELAAAATAGPGLPFELVDMGRRGSPLYCYRPLTGEFITTRMATIARLAGYLPARRLIAGLDGSDAYLRRLGAPRVPADPGERADAVLRELLCSVFHEATSFDFPPERFERTYRGLEEVLHDGRTLVAVVVALAGLRIASDEVVLGEGLGVMRRSALEQPPAALQPATSAGEHGDVVAVLALEQGPGAPDPAPVARLRFRRLLSALRLFDDTNFALGATGWARADDGPWWPVSLGSGGRARGSFLLAPSQEDELRAFVNLVTRRAPRTGPIAWALGRFELGCERPAPFDALSDYLLVGRALLEPEGPASGRLASRLAALCAQPEERPALAERVARAISLERAVIAGIAAPQPGADALVEELAARLRAVLRDVVCGHLDPDLCAVADAEIVGGAPDRPPSDAAPDGAGNTTGEPSVGASFAGSDTTRTAGQGSDTTTTTAPGPTSAMPRPDSAASAEDVALATG